MTELNPLADQINSMRTIRVSQGLFLLRYVSSKAGLNAPTLSVVTSPGSGVDLISPNENSLGRLVSPGDGLVIRAARDSFINVSVTPSHRNGSCDAELILERVSTTIRQAEPLSTPPETVRRDLLPGPGDIEVLAHVSRRGDVVTPAGQWICGPELPMMIEGIEIRWPKRPPGLEIMSRATINARGLRTLADQPTGSFQGTRGRAAPITSLTLSLVGPGAGDYTLRCEALFLGQPVMSVSGKSCTLSGSTGQDALVGLRISVVTAAVAQATQRSVGYLRTQADEAVRVPQREQAIPQIEKTNRVRIFRTPRSKPAPALSLSK